VFDGNRSRTLTELFKIENEKAEKQSTEDLTIRILGDVSKVRRIGAKMSMGNIAIDGDVGMHLGEEMKGGTITVAGNADSWEELHIAEALGVCEEASLSYMEMLETKLDASCEEAASKSMGTLSSFQASI